MPPHQDHVGDSRSPDPAEDGGLDLGALVRDFIPVPADEAAAIAARLYGLSGRMTRFATEKDDTFLIEPEGGPARILKIANPGESAEELDMQVALLAHLARVAPDLPVPRIHPDRGGAAIAVLTDRAGDRRHVRLMDFLPGTVLDRLDSTPAQRAAIGRILGRLRLAMAGFAHPGARRALAWDVAQLPGLGGLIDRVEDAEQRRALEAGFARFMAHAAPAIPGLRRQVLHNDFTRSNIVVDPQSPGFVTGIIDFGDAVETAIAIDISTALLNQLPREGVAPSTDLFAGARDLLAGYLEVADLTREERALIPHLVMGRVVGRAALTLWRGRLFPGNAGYILRNTGQGWAQLDWFLSRSPDEISQILLPPA